MGVQLQRASFIQKQNGMQWISYGLIIPGVRIPYRSIVWKYVFLLHLLKKNENSISAVYLALSKNRKNYFPARKTICPLIAKISSRKTQNIANPQK